MSHQTKSLDGPAEEEALFEPGRGEIIRERNRWFYELSAERKQEKLFELEVCLKGLDRFFNLGNQPISQKEVVVGRDFSNELIVLRNAVARVVRITQGLLPEKDSRALHFKNYVETSLLSDHQRAQEIERALLQRTPEESLYVLCHTFINFQEILAAVCALKKNSYFVFYHIEHLITREITGNRYFNPFKAAGFAPHYDVIKSQRFTRVVRGIELPPLRRTMSIIFLIMFKLLRYLVFLKTDTRNLEVLKDNLLIYALINSESQMLVDLLENDGPKTIKACPELAEETRRGLLEHLDMLAYQLTYEIKKLFELELKDAAHATEVNLVRTGMIRSQGLLNNMLQQGIVHLGQALDPTLEGKDVFRDFVSRLDESLKVRRDIWLFHRVIENLERVFERAIDRDEPIPVIEAMKTLRNFIFYYQNVSFQFVRCHDRDDFQTFFGGVDGFQVKDLQKKEKLIDFRHTLHAFKMFLETTLAGINHRAELRNIPFGAEEGERILSQFLS